MEAPTQPAVKLKVAEAIQDDVNKGIVRMDSTFMKDIGVRPGDIVELTGGGTTVAIVDRAYPGDIGLNIIRMDGITRRNAKTGISDQVNVTRADVKEAKKVTIAPARTGIVIRASPAIFKQGLLGRAVVKGDIVSLGGTRRRRTAMSSSPFFDDVFSMLDENLLNFGFGDLKFVVASTIPKQTVIITDATEVVFNPEPVEVTEDPAHVLEVSYEDIGGLSDEIKKIREMVELPLKHPEIFERLGIEPPKGVLLHGPPGTGKTLLAKAVANETNSHFLVINGPEIMSKFYGQSLPYEEKVLARRNGVIQRIPIGEIVERKYPLEVASFDAEGKVVWSPITGWITHERRNPLVEIKTKSGRSIRVTDDHSVFTLTKKGIESVKTSDLIAGTTYIAVPKRVPSPAETLTHINLLDLLQYNDHGLLIKNAAPYVRDAIKDFGHDRCAQVLGITSKYLYDVVSKGVGVRVSTFLKLMQEASITLDPAKIQIGTKGKSTQAILALTPDLCHFFGWWIAEGSYTNKNEVRLSLNADEANDIIALCTRLFTKVLVYKKNPRSVDIYICSGVLGKMMQALGFVGHARTKHVPPFVYSLDNQHLAAFLRGYVSGNGSVNTSTPAPQVELTTESPQLADDLCHLLPRFGIVAKIYDRRDRPQKRICFAQIGFVDQRRNEYIAQYTALHQSRRDRVPLDALEGIHSIGTQALTKQIVIPAELRTALHGDIFWDRIASITQCDDQPEMVYDISVPPYQNFIAGFGGIFAHNSEENLRKKFEEAEKHAPAIIFIDEVDAIATKREETRGEVERRVVAQLLALMDGLKSRGKVVVIAATNVPNTLDPALRRPGRFDRELEIGVPSVDGRHDILKIHTRNMPLAKDVVLKEIAQITHGFVGADLQSLAKEAAMVVLRRILPDLKYDSEEAIPKEILEKLIITKNDFKEALKFVRPSAMREVLVDIPNIKWESVGGLEQVKQELKEAVEWPLKHPDAFKRLGVTPPKGILMYGPPGTGKTMLAKAVANESEANFILVNGPSLLSKWVGESEKAVRKIFEKARQTSPTIIFFDEIDSLTPRRGASSDSHVTERVVNQLLSEIDGLEELHDVVIIGATNRPDMIDTALLRPGRFDRIILVPGPDAESRKQILEVHTKGMPISGIDLDALAKKLDGYSGADIESICREAAIIALRADMKAKEVGLSHFEAAIKRVPPSITKEIEKSYDRLQDKFKTARAKQMEEERPAYFG